MASAVRGAHDDDPDPTHGKDEPSVGALVVVFLFFLPFAFSEELVDAAAQPGNAPTWLLLLVDAALIAVILLIASKVRTKFKPRMSRAKFWLWGLLAALLTLLLDFVSSHWHDKMRFGPDVLIDVLYIVLTAILVSVALEIDPARSLSIVRPTKRSDDDRIAWRRFRALLPLLVGTFAAYVAAEAWDHVLAKDAGARHVGTEFSHN